MSGRAIGVFVLATVIGMARCGNSPAGPDLSGSEPASLLPASHLDCDSTDDIRARIDALEADGTLNAGRATALRNKLDQAERHESAGRAEEASQAYARLRAQVTGWVAEGSLSEEDVEDLLGCVTDVADGADLSFTAISAGGLHSCGLIETGAVYCWGFNASGQLGGGNAGIDSDTPVPVQSGTAFVSVSAGGFHTCGLMTGGSAFCWGGNAVGQLGHGDAGMNSDSPVAVSGSSFRSISAGLLHSCGVTDAGAALCWGSNAFGQLGDGNLGTNSDTPVPVADGHTFATISAGDQHTCGVTVSGTAMCWGSNAAGALGDGNEGVGSDTPVAVSGEQVFATISAGSQFTCGVTSGGLGSCWGRNFEGQLGDGSAATTSDTPVAVSGGHVFAAIDAGSLHTCGVTNAAGALCWGLNSDGQLGDGNAPTRRDIPALVEGGSGFETISGGGVLGSGHHTCGITASGDGFCWGDNRFGQLGDGNGGADSDTPVPVLSP